MGVVAFQVTTTEIKSKRDIDGNVASTFAFVGLSCSGDADVQNCIRDCNGIRWKQRTIKVQVRRRDFFKCVKIPIPFPSAQAAQESFMQRLQRERREKLASFKTEEHPSYSPMQLLKDRKHHETEEDSPDVRPDCKERRRKVRADEEEAGPVVGKKTGRACGGVVSFVGGDDGDDEVEEVKRRQYHSSSEDDSVKKANRKDSPMKKKKVKNEPPKAKPATTRKVYYSSSSSDEDEDSGGKRSSTTLMSKLSSFNSGFWGDDDYDDKQVPHPAKKTAVGKHSAREDPNTKRLESLKKRQREVRQQKDAIRSALAKVDCSARKINLEDEEEKESFSNAKSALFEDDDDEEDGGNDFEVRPQFQGKGGERLLALQSRLASGGDERFKLDSRFKDDEDDDDDDDSAEDPGEEPGEDLSAEQEKLRNLRILESVVGSSVSDGPSRKVHFTDMNQVRFDPDNEDQQPLQSKKKKKKERKINEEVAAEKTKETDEKAVPVKAAEATSFFLKKEAFSKSSQGGGGGFSFGFGASQSEKKVEAEAEPLGRSTKKKHLGFLERNPFKYDSSSSDEDEEDAGGAKEEIDDARQKELDLGRRLAAKSGGSSASSTREPFFFASEGDSRFDEITEFMSRKESLDEIRERYEQEERPALSAILKKRARSKAKRQRAAFGQAASGRRDLEKGAKKNRGHFKRKKFFKKK